MWLKKQKMLSLLDSYLTSMTLSFTVIRHLFLLW